ncbi:MAG: hypothetical protein J6S31_07950, partial [Lachnospiraceae bacterium]|nr:hypothetical protein [Lachnospiraceae bacterium]
MDRENDLLEQSVNTRKEGAQAASSAERRVRQVRPRTPGEAPARPAQNAAARPAQSGAARPTRTAAGERPVRTSSSDRPVRSAAQANTTAPRRTSAATPRTANPAQVQGRTPTQAQPRKVSPQDGTVRSAAPKQAQPRQAAPRQVTPRQAAGRGTSSRQSVRTAVDGGGRGGNTRTSSMASGRGDRKKKSGFKKFILIYSAILAVILIVGLIIFSSFIKKYEDNQPSNMVAGIVKQLSSNPSSYLKSNSEHIKCLENVDTIIDESVAQMEGKQLSYIENSDYRAEAPSFNITADGQIVAKVTLGKDSKGAFGLHSWKLTGLDVASYVPNTLSYTILVPEGATISINGTELTDAYKTKDAAVPETLQTASRFVSVPSFETYKVSGFANQPQVVAKAADGSDLGVSVTSDTIVCQASTSQEFIDSVDGLVNNAISAWGRHFINMGGNLRAYILDDCDYYGYIFGRDTMDPIYTAFYEFESIADYDFTEKSASNYIRYSSDCFTVDVKYQMRVDFTT